MTDTAAKTPAKPAGTVAVRAPDGDLYEVPVSEMAQLPEGASIASKQEVKAARNEVQYGDAKGQALSAAAGVARGLTFGGSDKFGSDVWGKDYREAARALQDTNPYASMGGELAGAALPVLLSGGAAAPEEGAGLLARGARAAGALPRGVAALGGAAERGVAAAIGDGATSLGGRMLQGALPKAASGLLEGAAYGAGHEVSEAALDNHELTGELLLAGGSRGALFGGMVGGALGAGSGVVKSAIAKLSPDLERVAVDMPEAAGAKVGADPSEVLAGGSPGKIARAAEPESNWIAAEADRRTIKAIGGTPRDVERINQAGRGGTMAQAIRQDLAEQTGKSIGWHSVDSINAYAKKRAGEIGEQLGAVMTKLDAKASAQAPDVASFLGKAQRELVDPIAHLPGSDASVGPVRKYLSEVAETFGKKPPTFSEWQRARHLLDDQINFNARNATPATKALKQLRGIMEGELEAAIERSEPSAGRALVDQYKATKSLYASVKEAENMSSREMARGTRRSSVGLLDTIAAVGGMATGGPLAGAASAIGSKLLRAHGDQVAADILSRVAGVDKIAQMSARTAQRITDGAKRAVAAKQPARIMDRRAVNVRPGAAAAMFGEPAKKREAFAKHAADVRSLATNPALASDHVAQRIGDMAHYAPKVANAVSAKMMGDIQYLYSKLPPPSVDPYSMTPQLDRHDRIPESEISRYARTLHALEDPIDVLRQVESRTLTLEAVNTIRDRRPLIYAEMQREVRRVIEEAKKPLDSETASRFALLFDQPTSRTQTPEFLRMLDQYVQTAPEGTPQSKPSQAPRGKAPNIADAYASGGDDLESR